MTAFIFFLLAAVASVGVIAWVKSLIGDIGEKLLPGIGSVKPRGLSPVDWSLILAAVELIGAAVIGVVSGRDVWTAWAIFLVILGLFELSLKEILRWADIVVGWIKKHDPWLKR